MLLCAVWIVWTPVCSGWCMQDYRETDGTCGVASPSYGCGTGNNCVTLPREAEGDDILSIIVDCVTTTTQSAWTLYLYEGTECSTLLGTVSSVGSGCYLGATVDCGALQQTTLADTPTEPTTVVRAPVTSLASTVQSTTTTSMSGASRSNMSASIGVVVLVDLCYMLYTMVLV